MNRERKLVFLEAFLELSASEMTLTTSAFFGIFNFACLGNSVKALVTHYAGAQYTVHTMPSYNNNNNQTVLALTLTLCGMIIFN